MPRAVVLGGYGLIGSACLTALADAGFDVTGIGRAAEAARAHPSVQWLIRDLTRFTVAEWRQILQGASVVVNAAGALQDGGRDDLQAIHVSAIARLVAAANETELRIIQISAAGASPEASTRFFRTKAAGDAIITTGARDWVILRPTLVLARDAYGGTALLRAAALPGLLPQVMPETKVMTVDVKDLAAAVVAAATGRIASGTTADLTAPESHSLPDLTLAYRRWMGLPDPVWSPGLPGWLLSVAGRMADGLGHFGWRSPLRTTALLALADGIRGDPSVWVAAGGAPCRPLAATLANHPATRGDRLATRVFLALPLAIATLAVFWTLSGLVALAAPDRAALILTSRGMGSDPATALVLSGAIADVALGFCILWRPWAARAALGMVLLSAAYLAGSLATAADLWTDPLGPMLKVLPGMALAFWVWLFLEPR